MFGYCVEVLHLSEHEAYLRIACARASRRFPVPGATAPAAARSATSTAPATAAAAAAARAALTTTSDPTAFEETGPEAVEAPAARAATRGAREAPRVVVEPIAPARFKVQFTANAELRDKLERAQALLRHKNPDCDLAEVVDEAVTLLLGKLESRRFGTTDKPKKTLSETDTSARSRHIPAAVRRAVYERDEGRCAYFDEATGRRCSCTDPGKLEYHHLTPFARGSGHDVEEIELRCRVHNQYQAELDFGRETIERHRTRTSRAREPRAAYGPAPAGPELRAAPREVASGGVAEAARGNGRGRGWRADFSARACRRLRRQA